MLLPFAGTAAATTAVASRVVRIQAGPVVEDAVATMFQSCPPLTRIPR